MVSRLRLKLRLTIAQAVRIVKRTKQFAGFVKIEIEREEGYK